MLVDGVPARRYRGFNPSFDIPMPDGSISRLQLRGQWTGLKAVVNGVETRLEPSVPRLVVVLAFLPLGLVAIGGLIGGLIGGAGLAINVSLVHRPMRWTVKVAAMLGVNALAAATVFGVAFAITPIPTLETGRGVNGIRDGAAVLAATTRPVDCARPHDSEVIGTFQYGAKGGYPGHGFLRDFAEQPCLEAFAAYVGVDYQSSSLVLILVTPSDLTWSKGDRQIGCAVVADGDGQLTGSVKGSAR